MNGQSRSCKQSSMFIVNISLPLIVPHVPPDNPLKFSPNKLVDFSGMGRKPSPSVFVISGEHRVRGKGRWRSGFEKWGSLHAIRDGPCSLHHSFERFTIASPLDMEWLKLPLRQIWGVRKVGEAGGGVEGLGCKTLSDCKHSPVTGFGSYMHTHRPFMLHGLSLSGGEV